MSPSHRHTKSSNVPLGRAETSLSEPKGDHFHLNVDVTTSVLTEHLDALRRYQTGYQPAGAPLLHAPPCARRRIARQRPSGMRTMIDTALTRLRPQSKRARNWTDPAVLEEPVATNGRFKGNHEYPWLFTIAHSVHDLSRNHRQFSIAMHPDNEDITVAISWTIQPRDIS